MTTTSDVLEDPVHVCGLILKHRESGASDDHLRQLDDMACSRIEQLIALMPDDDEGEHGHRHRQGDRQVKADFELEGLPAHSLLAVDRFIRLHRPGARTVPGSAE